jgi:hypothetical protein
MPRPCECGRVSSLTYFDPTKDCSKCFMWETSEDYRKWHSGERLPPKIFDPPEPPWGPKIEEPVGAELARIFEWFGAVKSGSCSCAKLQARMDRWGIAGVRENYSLILDKLERAAFERDLPIPRAMFIAPLELAIYRAARRK